MVEAFHKNNGDSRQGCKYVEIGGKKSFNNLEISLPLIERINMRFVMVFDWGTIKDDDFDECHKI